MKKRCRIISLILVLGVCIFAAWWGVRATHKEASEVQTQEGVYLEKQELPFYKNASGKYVAKDKKHKKAIVEWNKMFVYQGRRYVETANGWYSGWMPSYQFDESKDVWEVVEENFDSDDAIYLGLAKGEVGDDTLFSGNVRGRVYCIEGVEPEFMLRVESLGKRGRSEIYICDSGYSFNKGEDLYDKLLHLKETCYGIKCSEKRKNWNGVGWDVMFYSRPPDSYYSLQKEDMDLFMEGLCEAPFIYTEDCPFTIDYDKPKETGGLKVSRMGVLTYSVILELKLVEGGYVIFEEGNLRNICVKMDLEKFNRVFNKIGAYGATTEFPIPQGENAEILQ